ncbi:hypothetical protein BRX36_19265 [Sphingomonas sp. S-NIH.Pt1_0416]|nr:hypothetical protein BRX36_19265 [Sphingomonas sp. S-NIH.Pt1_0416]
MLDLAQRANATESVVARFRGRPFDWKSRRTCIHLARAQARALGHRPPSVPDFRSPLSARTALRSTGHETLEALLDSLFNRIAPAAMWLGDIALMAGGDGFDAIVIAVGGKMIGYHQDHLADGPVVIEPESMASFIGAWRL